MLARYNNFLSTFLKIVSSLSNCFLPIDWAAILFFISLQKSEICMMFVGNKEAYFECQKSCIMSDIQDGFFCKNNVLKVLIKPLHWPFINCFRSLHLRCFTEQFLLLCLTANTFEVMSFNEKDQDLHYPYQSKILCPGSKSKTKSR